MLAAALGKAPDAQARTLHAGHRQHLRLGRAQLREDRLGMAQQHLAGRG